MDRKAKFYRHRNQQTYKGTQNAANNLMKHWRLTQAVKKGEIPTTKRKDGKKMHMDAMIAPGISLMK